MKFELRDKTEEFVQFEREGKGIELSQTLLGKNMADYNIMLENLVITSSPNNHRRKDLVIISNQILIILPIIVE